MKHIVTYKLFESEDYYDLYDLPLIDKTEDEPNSAGLIETITKEIEEDLMLHLICELDEMSIIRVDAEDEVNILSDLDEYMIKTDLFLMRNDALTRVDSFQQETQDYDAIWEIEVNYYRNSDLRWVDININGINNIIIDDKNIDDLINLINK